MLALSPAHRVVAHWVAVCRAAAFSAAACWLLTALASAQESPSTPDVAKARAQLRHAELLEQLEATIGSTKDKKRLEQFQRDAALVRLEATLLGRAGDLTTFAGKPTGPVLKRIAKLEKSGDEELVLARLAFFVGATTEGEAAIGRARAANAELKPQTDKLLAEARKQRVPRGGYEHYRGEWLAIRQRDHCRALDRAIDALARVELEGFTLPFKPERDTTNRKRFDALGKGVGASKLRELAGSLRASLEVDYATVRTWIRSYAAQPRMRADLLKQREELRQIQTDALELIRRYDKPEQGKVDEFRKQLRTRYDQFRRLAKRDHAELHALSTSEAWKLHERIHRRESALDAVDAFFANAGLQRLDTSSVRPAEGSTVTTTLLLPGRRHSGLEDILWLVVKHAAGRPIDALGRAAELQRHHAKLTAWELLTLELLVADAVDTLNARLAVSLGQREHDFVTAVNEYRRTLGLRPLEIEERLNVSSRKHSQEMIDLGYFGHVSPVARNRTPTDRARLEGYNGGVGENCAAGMTGGAAAFEAWYHSPGHHRNLIGSGPHLGIGAAERTWTMVAGGTDWTWRALHRDRPPREHTELRAEVERFVTDAIKRKGKPTPADALSSRMPAIMPEVARVAFAASRDPSHAAHSLFPQLLGLIIDANADIGWRPLQIAAVAAAIDSLRSGQTIPLRERASQLIRPHLHTKLPFRAREREAIRAQQAAKIRAHWEDVAQWRFRGASDAAPPAPKLVAGRKPRAEKGRSKGKKAAQRMITRRARMQLAKKYGGSAKTQKAVAAGLDFLTRVQDDDGAWRAKAFSRHLERVRGKPGLGNAEWEIAMTGLALMALTSAGNTTQVGDHQQAVARGAEFLASKIVDYGRFDTTASHYMYNHAMATQALCDLYAYTGEPRIGDAAQLAIDFIVYAQHEPSGGWRYEANQAGDTSVTGWVLMALNAGYKAGLDVSGFRSALRFLDHVTQRPYYHVGYTNPNDRGIEKNRLTAVSMTGRLFVGAPRKDSRLVMPAYRLLEDLPAKNKVDFYYWYYATLALFQLGEPFWKKWNDALVPTLLDLQDDSSSDLAGSWPPQGEWANQGGRVYQTALGILMLTTYYRYDRAPKQRIHPYTGNIAKQSAAYFDALRDEPDAQRQQIAARKLVDKFGPSIVGEIAKILRARKDKLPFRKTLAALLVDVAAPQNESVLLGLLDEPDHTILEHVLRAVVRISSRKSVATLCRNLESRHRNVRSYCAESLGRLGDTSAVAQLSKRLAAEKDKRVRQHIEKALQRLQHRSSLSEFVQRALPKNATGLVLVLDGLEPLERADAVDPLLTLERTAPKRFERACAIVAEHRSGAAIPLLTLLMESDDLEIRTRAFKLIQALTHRRLGYDPKADQRKRRAALEDWRKWWKVASEGFKTK